MSILSIPKEHYFNLLKEKGLSATQTAIHSEIERLEHESFEGSQGYRPDLYRTLDEYRDFCREIWNFNLAQGYRPS